MSVSEGQPPAVTAGSGWRRIVLVVLLLGTAVVPYLGTLDADLVWDDRSLVGDRRFVAPDVLWQVVTGDFFGKSDEVYQYGYYRPLTTLSYYLTWRLVGEQPLLYHLSNISLHAACTLLLAVWLKLLIGSRVAAVIGALLFAVHPVHVESVAWVSGRTDVLCALVLLTVLILMTLRHWPSLRSEAEAPGSWSGRGLLATAILLTAVAPFAKEMALFLPLAVLVFVPFVGQIALAVWLAFGRWPAVDGHYGGRREWR